MPNILTQSNDEPDIPPGTPPFSMGLATQTPTRAATPLATAPSMMDRAKANMSRALTGLSSLLGRTISSYAPQPTLPAATPNILTAVPQIPVQPPLPPVPAPRGQPTPYSLNTWLSKQTSK